MGLALSLSDEFQTSPAPGEVTVLDYQIDSLPFDRIRCPDLRKVGKFWLDLPREEAALPDWSAFDPFAFGLSDVLGKLCVLQVGNWRRNQIEFTLYGSHAAATIGNGQPLSMQEMRLHATRHANYFDIRDRAGRAIDNEAPQYARKTLSWDGRDSIEYETLMLPFQPDPDGTRRLLNPASML